MIRIKCPHRHTVYDPPMNKWECPQCGMDDPQYFYIEDNAGSDFDCDRLHWQDRIICEKCGLNLSGQRVATRMLKKNGLTICRTCGGLGYKKTTDVVKRSKRKK